VNGALIHSDGFAADPAACVAAIQSLEALHSVVGKRRDRPKGTRMLFDDNTVRELSLLPKVYDCFSLGTVLAVTLETGDADEGNTSSTTSIVDSVVERLRGEGILAHGRGSDVFVEASPMANKEDCSRMADSLHEAIVSVGDEVAYL
jgi:adenosylmethionine-8-amino-7-oxononanoate aminotransferase